MAITAIFVKKKNLMALPMMVKNLTFTAGVLWKRGQIAEKVEYFQSYRGNEKKIVKNIIFYQFPL